MIYIIAIVFGLVIGSFLNVVIYRIPRKGSVVSPRWSYCPNCNHTLGVLDNIPVFSYVFLGGKCRYCRERISPRYMIVELLTAGLFTVMLYRSMRLHQDTLLIGLELAAMCIFAAILIAISFIDLEFTIIPNRIIYPGIIVGLLFAVAMAFVKNNWNLLLMRLLGAAVGGVVIILIVIGGSAVFRKQAMGIGDVKLMAMIGIYLGPWPHIPITLIVGSILGSIIGIGLIAGRKKKMDSAIPFGPFLAIGALFSLFYGEAFWAWYQNITGLAG